MRNIIVFISILLLPTYLNLRNSPLPDVEVVWSHKLDKEKRELFKKLKVKTETEIKQNYSDLDSLNLSTWIYKKEYDENGNQISYKVFNDTLMQNPRYEEDYVTDDMGNVIEAYRNGELIGEQEFDDAGRITELINYDEEGNERWSYEYEYDEEGNQTLELEYSYGDLYDTLVYDKFEYAKIGNKKLLKSKINLLGPSKILFESKVLYDYDSLGREISYLEYGRQGKIYMEKYRNYKSLTGIRRFYGSDGLIDQIDSQKINIFGKVTEAHIYKNGLLSGKRFFEYYHDSLLVKETEVSSGNENHFQWKYDNSGHEILFTRIENNEINYKRTSKYSDNGLIIETKTNDIKKNKIENKTYKYEFY